MQTVSTEFENASLAKIRHPKIRVKISWDKTLSPDYSYFTIGTSTIGGADIVKGDDILQNEFSYRNFDDETIYIEDVEIDRWFDEPLQSVAKAMCDIVINNASGRFNLDGPLGNVIKNNRLIQIELGFGDEYIPIFRGQTVEFPNIDEKQKIVKLHALDFGYLLSETAVQETTMLTNAKINEILELFMSDNGILPTQYDFLVSSVIIPFLIVNSDQKLGKIISKLAQVEFASFFADETGKYKYLPRDTWNFAPYNTPVLELTDDLVLDVSSPTVDNIINAVEVKAEPREVQPFQPVYSLESSREIQAGEELEIWADLGDPCIGVDIPYRNNPYTGSSFSAGQTANDELNSFAKYVDLVDFYSFGNSVKMVFKNNHSQSVYLKDVVLYAYPAKVAKTIYYRQDDETSKADFGEHLIPIENEYIQTKEYAQTIAQMLLDDRKDLTSYKQLVIRGIPQLQLGDLITYKGDDYTIMRIKTHFSGKDGLLQTIKIAKKVINQYFRIGISAIGGSDKIGP